MSTSRLITDRVKCAREHISFSDLQCRTVIV